MFSGQNTNFEKDLEALERWFQNLVPLTFFLTTGSTDMNSSSTQREHILSSDTYQLNKKESATILDQTNLPWLKATTVHFSRISLDTKGTIKMFAKPAFWRNIFSSGDNVFEIGVL